MISRSTAALGRALCIREVTGSNFGLYEPSVTPSCNKANLALPAGVTQRGIAVDSAGNIWIAVGSTSATTSGQAIYVYDQIQDAVIHKYSLGNGGYDPFALTFDAAGNLWIADRNAHMVEEMNSSRAQFYNKLN